jgi:hypothetical protein
VLAPKFGKVRKGQENAADASTMTGEKAPRTQEIYTRDTYSLPPYSPPHSSASASANTDFYDTSGPFHHLSFGVCDFVERQRRLRDIRRSNG